MERLSRAGAFASPAGGFPLPALSAGAWAHWPQTSWHDPWAPFSDRSDWSDEGSTCSSGIDVDSSWAVHATPEPAEIIVVSSMSSSACSSLCEEAARADVVAIDLEWVPDWTAGSNNPISVMQLAFPYSQRVYVLQLGRLRGRLPAAVQMMLVNPEVTIVGFAVDHGDFAKLALSEIAILRSSLIDIQQRCSLLLGAPSSPCSLRSAAFTFLQFRLAKDKRVTCSDWARAELTPAQIHYAAMDAWVTLRLFYSVC